MKNEIIKILRDKGYGDKDRQKEYESQLKYKANEILELFKQQKEDIIKEIRKKLPRGKKFGGKIERITATIGYNQAIDEVRELLNKLK